MRARPGTSQPCPSACVATRGNASAVAVITLLVIGSLAGVVLTVMQRHSGEVSTLGDQDRAFFVAQAGVNEALSRLESGDTPSLGSADDPRTLLGSRYWVDVRDNGDETFTLTARARAGLQQEAIEVVARQEVQGVFHNGIFAGNSANDPSYTLDLGGLSTQADQVYGDVYSGGSVGVHGDAEVFGTIRAKDGVAGKGSSTVETGKEQAIPAIAGMHYEVTSDVKVAEEFVSGGPTYRSNSAGGKAWELPEDNPAHIFRKNPSDRTTETSSTDRDDYFLEDPYEPVHGDSKSDGSDAYQVTFSGVSGEPGTNSNRKVFFIDGNLWIHNDQTMSFQFASKEANGLQVTIVVKGNIYISDNLYYTNTKKDGVAFIAMKDSAVKDSGNIYFGDPRFGTLERMNAYLYAENDFHDVNLSATGSARVELYGNMTAGNQVTIQRDFNTTVSGKTVVQHSRLMVDFDERVEDGELDMPGLPHTAVSGAGSFSVLSWREVEHE